MIRLVIAFLASALTAIQAFLIYTRGQGICLNDGCGVVESLTLVPPFFFNIAGFIFFQVVFWAILWGRNGQENLGNFAKTVLLGGLATEAVLIFFQYEIAATFCSYCLIIFGAVLLLNIFCGLSQIVRGLVVFSAVLVACFSLKFSSGGAVNDSLTSGSIAQVKKESDTAQLYLFFSKSCAYCEKVLESLRQENNCSISFNPVDEVENFSFPGAVTKARGDYDPMVNFQMMKTLGVSEVPLLMIQGQDRIEFIKGGTTIQNYIDSTCKDVQEEDYSGGSSIVPTSSIISGTSSYVTGSADQDDEACEIGEDCVEPLPELLAPDQVQ